MALPGSQTAMQQVQSETAYDALQDGLPLVLRLLSDPLPAAALAQPGEELAAVTRKLERLVRAGLIRKDGERYTAVARLVHQTRQEGMVTFLSRYVLPMFTRLMREPGQGFVTQLELALGPDEQSALRGGVVQELVEELNRLSDEPAAPGEAKVACTAVVLGTSDVPPQGEAGERLLETVRRCARERATPGRSERAVLTQYDALFGVATVERAEAAVRSLASRLAAERAAGAGTGRNERPGYTLAIGFCVR